MKILDLTTDCLLHAWIPEGHELVHCQTGRSVMHSGCSKTPPKYRHWRLLWEVLRGRRYSWVILPPVHVNWTIGNHPLRSLAKKILSLLIGHAWIARGFLWLCFGSKTKFACTDYSDMFAPSEFALRCFRPNHYFMLNLPSSMVGTRTGPASTLIHYLPTVIQDQLIDDLVARHPQHRDYDVFVAGTYHNLLREIQLQAAHMLDERSYKVFELKEKSFEKFTNGILSSKLCLAAKGLSYHCFRPLEAAAAGAATVWHYPENDAHHDYINGVNTFLYDPRDTPEKIAALVERVLQDPARISIVAKGALFLLEQKHRASALSRNLWSIFQSAAS